MQDEYITLSGNMGAAVLIACRMLLRGLHACISACITYKETYQLAYTTQQTSQKLHAQMCGQERPESVWGEFGGNPAFCGAPW